MCIILGRGLVSFNCGFKRALTDLPCRLPLKRVGRKKSLEENQHLRDRGREGLRRSIQRGKRKMGMRFQGEGRGGQWCQMLQRLRSDLKSGASSHSLMVSEPLPKKSVLHVIRCTLPLLPCTAGFFSGLLRTWQNRKEIPHLEIKPIGYRKPRDLTLVGKGPSVHT